MHMSAIPTTTGAAAHTPTAKRPAPASANPFKKHLLAIII